MSSFTLADLYGRQDVEIVKCAGVNSFYGHSSIIRRYSGYPCDKPIPYIVQHGTIGLSQDFYEIREWHERELLNYYWAWNHSALEQADKYDSKFTVEAIGSPFLYFLRLIRQAKKHHIEDQPVPSQLNLDDILPRVLSVIDADVALRQCMAPVVFAPHSLPNRKLNLIEHKAFAEYLTVNQNINLGTVCLHPYDVYLGNHIAYQDAGFKIKCCMDNAIEDYPWDEHKFWTEYHKIGIEFMLNLYVILKESSACYFCGLSTPLFYAGNLKKRCKLIKLNGKNYSNSLSQISDIIQKRPVTPADSALCSKLEQLLNSNKWSKHDVLTFKSYCDSVLGRQNLISRKEMKSKLEHAQHHIR